MKKIVIFAMGLVLSSTTHAQENIETTISGDFVSSYIWRGQDLGSAAVQPTLGVGYKGMSLTAWGSYGLANPDDVKEFDLTLGYAVGGFNIAMPIVRIICLKPTSATTLVLPHYSGSPTSPATTV